MKRLPKGCQLRSGKIMVWLALCLGIVLGVVALNTDGGRLFQERRQTQASADAAALAGAGELHRLYATYQGKDVTGAARQAALDMAASNGDDNDGITSIVTV